ncbi:hypothetical protein ACC671_10960 [Rhizobium ruizarguesonis]
MSDHTIRSESKGYNRGLILGFTMAESLLLVVFCLLLVAGAIISKERLRASTAEQNSARLEAEVTKKAAEIKQLRDDIVVLTANQPDDIREQKTDWRELVLAHKIVETLTVQLAEKDAEKITDRVQAMLEKETASAKLLEERQRLEKELSEANARLAALVEKQIEDNAMVEAAKNAKPHEWPPIISLSEANGNYFKSGSAQLELTFVDKLNGKISEEIATSLKNYGADIVEVIGHTDEQPVSRSNSTMDKNVIDVLSSKKSVDALVPADNAGLGLARAISVANVLRANASLSGITVLPLSGAQLILPGDTVTAGESGAVENRRRIEIRIRRRLAPIQ